MPSIIAKKIERLDIFLKEYLSNALSRSEIQRAILKGQAKINNKPTFDKNTRVRQGDRVTFEYKTQPFRARPDILLKIIFENEDFLVIDKPAGIVVHTNPRQDKPSIAAAIAGRLPEILKFGEDFRPGIVHRLDLDTSGVLLVAKTKKKEAFLKKLFAERKIEKEYFAVVYGKLTPSHGFYDQPIGRVAGNKKFFAGIGRPSLTEFWVEKYYKAEKSFFSHNLKKQQPFETGPRVDPVRNSPPQRPLGRASAGVISNGVDIFTLVRIQLHTGRTHQIRVHFAENGFPVAGDMLYAGKYKKINLSSFPRQLLHAYRIKFRDASGKAREFISPLPPDFIEFFKIVKELK